MSGQFLTDSERERAVGFPEDIPEDIIIQFFILSLIIGETTTNLIFLSSFAL